MKYWKDLSKKGKIVAVVCVAIVAVVAWQYLL